MISLVQTNIMVYHVKTFWSKSGELISNIESVLLVLLFIFLDMDAPYLRI